LPAPEGPGGIEIGVADIDDPLPDATFGSIGRYVEVSHADDRSGRFVPQPLVLEFDALQAEHVDPWTLRIFEVDVEARSFSLLESSRADPDRQEVWGWIDHPGTYGVIGLPRNAAVLETLRLLERLRPQLLEERARGEQGLQDRVCGLILCENPTQWGGGPLPPGDLCARCLGLDISFGRLPELVLLEERLHRVTALDITGHRRPRHPVATRLLAWGYNGAGQLGDGTSTDRMTPVWVPGIHARKIAGGTNMSYALETDGTVWAWGDNFGGELGDGSTTERASPGQVLGLTNIVDVAAGHTHALAVRSDRSLWFWGSTTTASALTPVRIAAISSAVAVAAGTYFSLVATSDGHVWAWGDNTEGQLGDGSRNGRGTPAQVPGLADVRSVAAGLYSSFAVHMDGTVSAWGRGLDGMLGDGAGADRLTPVVIPGLAGVVEIASGWHALARTTTGEVWAWGDGRHGAVGTGTNAYQLTPVRVPGLPSVTKIAAGADHSLAIDATGNVWAWGENVTGEIGDGGPVQRDTPVQVPLPGNVKATNLGAGMQSSFAVVT